MVGFPNNHGKTPTKNDQHLGWEMGVPSFKETPIQISRSAVVSFTSYPGSQIPSETSGFKGLSRTSKMFYSVKEPGVQIKDISRNSFFQCLRVHSSRFFLSDTVNVRNLDVLSDGSLFWIRGTSYGSTLNLTHRSMWRPGGHPLLWYFTIVKTSFLCSLFLKPKEAQHFFLSRSRDAWLQ